MLFWLGSVLCKKVPVFNRYCIPAPLVGGVCFAAVNTILYASNVAFISFDDTLQTVFMNIFFTTVGFTVSLPQLKKGGKSVALCLILAIAITFAQNIVGVGIVGALGADPRLGLCAGLACATFGLVSGSIMGGPTAARRIRKHNLICPNKAANVSAEELENEGFTTTNGRFVKGFMLLMLALGIGSFVGAVLTDITGITFPSYIGAMIPPLLSAMWSMRFTVNFRRMRSIRWATCP